MSRTLIIEKFSEGSRVTGARIMYKITTSNSMLVGVENSLEFSTQHFVLHWSVRIVGRKFIKLS